MQMSCRNLPWKFIVLGIVICAIVLVCMICINEKVPAVLGRLNSVRERRWDPEIFIGSFLLMVVAVPLATLPSGTVLLSACILAYLYGFLGYAIGWPAFAIGLLLNFSIARCLSKRGRNSSENRSSFVANAAATPTSPESGGDSNRSSVPSFLQGESSAAFFRVVKRMLDDQPKRTAALFTFSFHAPSLMFFFGWGTELGVLDVLPAACLDGSKLLIPILKGLAIRDILDAVHNSNTSKKPVDYEHLGFAVGLKLFVALIMSIAIFVVANEVRREFVATDPEADDEEKMPLMEDGGINKASKDDLETDGNPQG
mmetsp:Transcript_72166/g.150667  ORF Transcript_72166/g.150667 Transcript_72166/m.150667 type:complete len:313 (+) Transcript_72166:120-1058(+)|eukprot:CAMPEP_0206478576 /NCGR_PEP_ID=MMETSP0324_2-20121206/36133_1 /ASSEMBLY_ACC=CAM_ASM_000836 /TAXON_ID=2866 /ORGANISM="Crypthecodinium cohnii, Strain Seligo" /LENGTH=312 /DNA_ID=CAMNT_0053954903 /DNA_START=53 /DNA_END=991 /DNA_ORIENTATION=-